MPLRKRLATFSAADSPFLLATLGFCDDVTSRTSPTPLLIYSQSPFLRLPSDLFPIVPTYAIFFHGNFIHFFGFCGFAVAVMVEEGSDPFSGDMMTLMCPRHTHGHLCSERLVP